MSASCAAPSDPSSPGNLRERLAALEARAGQQIDALDVLTRSIDALAVELRAALYGSPDRAGLTTRLDRLEQSAASRGRLLTAAWAALLALGADALHRLLGKP